MLTLIVGSSLKNAVHTLDLGKVLLHPSFGQLPQWAVVGDTFPVGCAYDESNVHRKVLTQI